MAKQPPIFSKVFLLLSLCQVISLLSLILVIMSDYFQPPIQCLIKPKEKAIQTYCYIQALFTLQNSHKELHGYDYYPGVGPDVGDRESVSHAYFFWMPYFLCFQVFLFGFPRQVWNSFSESLLSHLSSREYIPNEKYLKKIDISAKYFVLTLHTHKSRACVFLVCEALGVAIIVANIFLTNWYLGGRFLHAIPHLFLNILRMDEIDNLYDRLFPKLCKCTFHAFGTTGTIVKKDVLCVLARNLLTGRIFTLHFAVFSIAAVIATLSYALRVTVFLSPKLRQFLILKKMSNMEDAKDDLRYIVKFCDFGDWFLLFHLACTMVNFNLLLGKITKQLQDLNRTTLWRTLNEELEEN